MPYLLRYVNQWRLIRKCKRNKAIILTFDDGPGAVVTPLLLDLFKKNEVTANFFILGSKIEGNESIIKEMSSLGHEIGSHGFSHLNAFKTNPLTSIRDISRCIKALSNIGIECKLFRPPYGKINIFTWSYLLSKKQQSCWWSDDSGDTFAQLPCPISFASKIVNKGGGVVLMHDHHKSQERINFIINSTTKIIELAKKNGLEIKTFGQVLDL